MFDFYGHMKPKFQKAFNAQVHWDKLFNVLLSRFEYGGLPDNIQQRFLEGVLLCNGTAGITKVGEDLWAIPGSYCGNTVGYLPEEYFGILPNVDARRGKIGEQWAVGLNNETAMPELILYQYAHILSEIDVSEKCNVLFSRFMRIPKVSNEREKTAVKAAIQNITDGKIDALVSDNVLNEVQQFMDYAPEEPFLDLVDVRQIDKIQYLNQYRDNIIKRFFQIYGQKTQVTSKMAQMSPDEVHANDSMALILTTQALRCREKMCEDVNTLFGTNWTVKLSECWEDEIEEMENDEMNTADEMGGEEDGSTTETNETVGAD